MRAAVAPAAEPASASQPLQVGAVEVWLWWVRLDVSRRDLERCRDLLAPEERAEADRRRRGRDRFVAGRGLLRQVLGRHLGIEAATLRFGRSPAGKPFLRDLTAAPAFSASRSGAWQGIALTTHGAVGLDIERLRDDVDCSAVAEHLFAPGERAALAALAPAARRRAFFSGWVRREACLKGVGTGLALPPEQLEVGLEPALAAVTCQHRRWLVQNVAAPQAGYVAAIAVENRA